MQTISHLYTLTVTHDDLAAKPLEGLVYKRSENKKNDSISIEIYPSGTINGLYCFHQEVTPAVKPSQWMQQGKEVGVWIRIHWSCWVCDSLPVNAPAFDRLEINKPTDVRKWKWASSR